MLLSFCHGRLKVKFVKNIHIQLKQRKLDLLENSKYLWQAHATLKLYLRYKIVNKRTFS